MKSFKMLLLAAAIVALLPGISQAEDEVRSGMSGSTLCAEISAMDQLGASMFIAGYLAGLLSSRTEAGLESPSLERLVAGNVEDRIIDFRGLTLACQAAPNVTILDIFIQGYGRL